mmetsp:Transcript_7062/g.19108  ORF Transcript_7062/g.19108 Transcript_7062/m.19108 type:complete len:202 (-) Transcript_7062:1413-2018(-)
MPPAWCTQSCCPVWPVGSEHCMLHPGHRASHIGLLAVEGCFSNALYTVRGSTSQATDHMDTSNETHTATCEGSSVSFNFSVIAAQSTPRLIGFGTMCSRLFTAASTCCANVCELSVPRISFLAASSAFMMVALAWTNASSGLMNSSMRPHMTIRRALLSFTILHACDFLPACRRSRTAKSNCAKAASRHFIHGRSAMALLV